MCGITGLFQYAGAIEEQKDSMRKLIKMMERRGPDAEGIWSDDKHCILGFRRLAILDLSPAGNQPMISEDGRYALVFNGEVYNFQDLRQTLQEKGFKFHSTGDTEVVLKALIHWGAQAFERFNGMFAIAFYDSFKKELLIGRDYAGIKPLYYLKAPEGILFASQYDQIFCHPWGRNLALSQNGLGLYLRLGYIPAPYGMFEQTHMLEAGTWLRFDLNGQTKQECYFTFPMNSRPDLTEEAAAEAVESVLRKAVKRHLISDVTVGTFLSGGIDSPLVSSFVKETANKEVPAFTFSVPGDEIDETAAAKSYANEIGLKHTLYTFSEQEILNQFKDWTQACAEPFADYSLFPTMLICRHARKEVKVMLSGDGADELFWGYGGRFGSVIHASHYFQEPLLMRQVRWGLKKFLKLGDIDRNIQWPSIGDWYRTKQSRIPEAMLNQLLPEVPKWPDTFKGYEYQGWEKDTTAQWLRWNEYQHHLSMVLLKVDRASMFHSLEVRVPFLDKEMIELSTQIDWRSCLNAEKPLGKLLLRKILSKRVTQQSIEKKGFDVPMRRWLQGPLKKPFEDLVLNQSFLGLRFNSNKLESMFQNHQTNKENHTLSLWLLLSLAIWNQKYLNRAAL